MITSHASRDAQRRPWWRFVARFCKFPTVEDFDDPDHNWVRYRVEKHVQKSLASRFVLSCIASQVLPPLGNFRSFIEFLMAHPMVCNDHHPTKFPGQRCCCTPCRPRTRTRAATGRAIGMFNTELLGVANGDCEDALPSTSVIAAVASAPRAVQAAAFVAPFAGVFRKGHMPIGMERPPFTVCA